MGGCITPMLRMQPVQRLNIQKLNNSYVEHTMDLVKLKVQVLISSLFLENHILSFH